MAFRGDRVALGRFRAATSASWFRDSGPARGYLVVFPRTAVRIIHAGRSPVIADPTRVMFYNLGQEYVRERVSPEGDRCDWFSYRPEDVAEAVRRFDAGVEARMDRPFATIDGPSDPRVYAAQRVLFERVAGGAIGPSELVVEEASLCLLDRVVARAYRWRGIDVRRPGERAARAHRALVAAVKEQLATRFSETLRLGEVAAAVGASPFHVARVFRRETGETIHAHLNALRLRHALERIGDVDLTTLGLDLGYSSHSHFTLAFRRAFGVPPSAMRRRLRARA